MPTHPALADASRGLRHVFLRNMAFDAAIGVYGHEHGRRQRIRVNVDLAVLDPLASPDTSPGIGDDDLERVTDYAQIAQRVREIVLGGHVRLVETLAERLAAECLDDPRVRSVRVRVEKLDVLPEGESAGVEVERIQPR